MFALQDCFSSSGVFNEALVKRFKETYDPQNGSRLWMIPGHVIYTTPKQKIYSCDARPLDLLSPSEPSTGELVSTPAPVLDIFFSSEESPRMYIAFTNGDVQIFEYRALLYEWARVGYFNVNIMSPNTVNHSQFSVEQIFLSSQQGAVYWSERTGQADMCLTLQKRILPSNSVREITQSAIGPPVFLLKNCPKLELLEVAENVFIVPHLPNSVNLYFILSPRCHLWLCDISGKCLWRGAITEHSLDFLSLCMKGVGLWTQKGMIKVCKALCSNIAKAFIFHDSTLLSIAASGEISKRTKFDLTLNKLHEYYVLQNILCSFTSNSLEIYDLSDGKQVQTISLENCMPIRGTWYHASTFPCLGFFTDNQIMMLWHDSLVSIISSKTICLSQVVHLLGHDDIHFLALLRDLVHAKLLPSDLKPLRRIPERLQSKAILLALIQLCKDKDLYTDSFPFNFSDLSTLLAERDDLPYLETRLKQILDPLVDCYCKLETAKREAQKI